MLTPSGLPPGSNTKTRNRLMNSPCEKNPLSSPDWTEYYSLRPAHYACDARDRAENGKASKASRRYEKCSISFCLPLGRSTQTPQYKAGATRSEKPISPRGFEGLTA